MSNYGVNVYHLQIIFTAIYMGSKEEMSCHVVVVKFNNQVCKIERDLLKSENKMAKIKKRQKYTFHMNKEVKSLNHVFLVLNLN